MKSRRWQQKKRKDTPKIANFNPTRRKKAAKRRGGERKKAGNARPKKKKRPKRRENRRTKAQKMPSPPKKIKKSLETPAFSPILTDFSVSFRTFAVFSPLLRLVLLYFCAVFALSTAVFSSFLLYFAIPFRFFHCFFTVFGSFSSFLTLFSPFKVSAAPCARFFGVWFSFFRFSFDFFVILLPFLPSAVPYPPQKSTFLSVSLLSFSVSSLVWSSFVPFFAFSMFFPVIVGICRGKIENSPFSFIEQQKIVRTAQTTAQEGKYRQCRKEKTPSKGKIGAQSGHHLAKNKRFSP